MALFQHYRFHPKSMIYLQIKSSSERLELINIFKVLFTKGGSTGINLHIAFFHPKIVYSAALFYSSSLDNCSHDFMQIHTFRV